MKMINLSVAILFILALIASPSWAKGSDVIDAQNRVIQVTRNIVKKLELNENLYKKKPAALTAMIRKEVLPFIDFEAMSKLTLGKHWRSATPAQRTRFINAYREMLVRSYGKAMLKYAGATILPGNSVANNRPGYVIVRTKVRPKGLAPVSANYDVRKKTGDWKAYNIQIAGVNLITNFRTNFTREVSAKGLNALITRLEKTGR